MNLRANAGVVEHMSSEPLEVYLMLGKEGLLIKKFIRQKYLKELPNNAHNYLYNFVHTPDIEDFMDAFDIFFK